MSTEITLFILFLLTACSATTGNLKSMYMIKGNAFQQYFTTAIDSVVYGLSVLFLVKGSDLVSILVFAFGKVCSVYFTRLIFSKTNKTVYKCNVYLSSIEAHGLELFLFNNNISFSRVNETFLHSERAKVSMHVTKDQYDKMLGYLKSIGIENPTLDMTEVRVKGNIERRTNGEK